MSILFTHFAAPDIFLWKVRDFFEKCASPTHPTKPHWRFVVTRDRLLIARQAFDGWLGSIIAASIRELHERRTRSGSSLMVVLEPLGLVLVISGGHYFLAGSVTRPPYGSSTILFYATGILPHYVFIWVSSRVSGMRLEHSPFPRIKTLDRVIAIAGIEYATLFVTMILIFAGLWLWGVREAWPYDLFGALAASSTMAIFGIGMGLINAVIAIFVPIWRGVYHLLIRVAMLVSGLFFIPDFILPWARSWLVWNPLLHGVGWFRLSFYPDYPSRVLDIKFLLSSAIISLVIGLALEQVTKRQRVLH